MTADEAAATLYEVATLRFPHLKPLGHLEKINAIEDYLGATAIARGDLEEARLHVGALHQAMKSEWDDIEGWEMHVSVPTSRRTGEDVRQAKKRCRPDLFAALSRSKFLLDELARQIRRLEADDAVASREYTIITG